MKIPLLPLSLSLSCTCYPCSVQSLQDKSRWVSLSLSLPPSLYFEWMLFINCANTAQISKFRTLNTMNRRKRKCHYFFIFFSLSTVLFEREKNSHFFTVQTLGKKIRLGFVRNIEEKNNRKKNKQEIWKRFSDKERI